jgi:hypothetical protein
MAFCPNINSKEYKNLEAVQGEAIAHYLWDKFRGDVPSGYYKESLEGLSTPERRTIADRKQWLVERGISVEVFDTVQNIGSEEVHGYVENAAVYLWSQANTGTEYHEAYHVVFRSMLSNTQRASLYAEAAAQFGEPTVQDINNVRKAFPNISDAEARMVALEEKMADDFKEYVLTDAESAKTLPGKIAKFFKDIWNFLKAIFSNGLSLRQMYSIIESNKLGSTLLGKGVFRNAEKFKGPDKAYMYRPEMGARMFEAALDDVFTTFMDSKIKAEKAGEEFTAANVLGVSGRRGDIASGYIQKLYIKANGDRLKHSDAAQAFEAELLMDAATTPEEKAAAKATLVAILKPLNAGLAMGNQKEARMVYKNIASTWNDIVEPVTENIIKVGWRSFLEIKLREAGIAIINGKVRYDIDINNELNEEDRAELEEEFDAINSEVAKIYTKTSLEDSPSKRLTGKIKEALSTIKSNKTSLLGKYTYLSREEVYKELLLLFNGRTSYPEMIQALRTAASVKPNLVPILKYMEGLTRQDAAMFFSAFALVNTEFIMIRKRLEGTKMYADIINPNRKDVITGAVDRWKAQIISRGNTNPRAIYDEIVRTDADGKPMLNADGSPITVLRPNKEKLLQAQAIAKELEAALKGRKRITADVLTTDGSIGELADKTAQLMWLLGMNVGDNTDIAETKWAIQSIINVGVELKSGTGRMETFQGSKLLGFMVDDLTRALKLTGDFAKSKTSSVAALNTVNIRADYISSNKELIERIASYFGPLLNTVGESFVNAQGKAIYPTNISSHMHDIVNIIKAGNGEAVEMMNNYMSDPFFNGGGNNDFASILFRHLKNAPTFISQFKVVDFDASKGESYDDTLSYEDFSKVDNLVVRINAFINNDPNSPTVFIAVPVQSDRNKFSFVEVPRVLAGKYGIQQSESELVKAQIVQDFLRVAAAKKAVHNALRTGDYSKLIEGYHTKLGNPTREGVIKDGEYLGNAFKSDFFQFTAKRKDDDKAFIVTDLEITDPSGKVIKDNSKQHGFRQISDVIEKYVKGELSELERNQVDNKINSMVKEMSDYFTRQAQSISDAIEQDDKESDIGFGATTAKPLELYRGFIVTETLMRNELVKLFRGNRAMTKNLSDFYKRMGHLTTPGTKIAMQGDLEDETGGTGEPYGMIREFNEITLQDLRLNLTPKLFEQADLAADNIFRGLVKSGVSTEEAKRIADSYRPGEFDSTDAQAYISLDMHRYIGMGLGQWGTEEEEAYKAYKVTGKFVYQPGFVPTGFEAGEAVPARPWKPYYEALEYSKELNVLLPVSEKNSYSVLIQEYTKDFPHLEDLRQRMEATGTYTGFKPVHVVNFVSGKKLAKRGVYKSTGVIGEYSNVVVNKNKSSRLRFPQMINGMKEDAKVTLNRQIKKNMISNVSDGTIYTFNSGLAADEVDMNGRNMKALYHAAIEEKLRRDTEKVLDELGITALREAVKSDDINVINKVKLEVLKTVRRILSKQLQENDLPSNYSTALNIAFDETGAPKFSVPIDLPIYNKKYESIIMSILNNSVFKQKGKGFEAVQVSQLGGHAVDNALEFLQISEDGRRVIHAEIMIREDVARKFGIKPGQSLDEVPEELRRVIGYRIPNQDKASVVICKIAKILPANYEKAVVIPGQLLKLMGSDHDVDKLNLLFPEVQEDKTSKYGISKVRPDYNGLIDNLESIKDPTLASDAVLNNIILDTIEAVYSNPAHFKEVFTPLDDTTLEAEVNRIREAMPELAEATDWNSWDTEANTIVRNMKGTKLRGIYANILAGRNVAMHGRVEIKRNNAIIIESVDENGKKVETAYTSYLKIADGIFTDKAISLWLSAAVDASKLPIQYELNDSEMTSRVRALFLAYYPEYNSATCTNLLNQPIVREMTALFESKYGGNLTKVTKAYEDIVSKHNLELPDPDSNFTYPLDVEELQNLKPLATRDMNKQAIILHNFKMYYESGKQLMNLYKRITPDSMDGMNRIGSIQGFKDRAGAFEERQDTDDGIIHKDIIFFGPEGKAGNVVDQFVGENSIYGLERGYENLLNNGLEVAGSIFPVRTSAAFLTFKERLKGMASSNQLTSEMHQLVDYNLMFMMLMRKGSPFFENASYESLYSDPTNNIGTQLTQLKLDNKALASNPFISKLELDSNLEAKYYGVKFDASTTPTRADKESMTNGLRAMLFNPIAYVSASAEDKQMVNGKYKPEIEKEVKAIRKLGRDLVMHTFITNGFRQSSNSYSDIIPVEFFTTPMKVKGRKDLVSIADFFEEEKKNLNDANYFQPEDMLKYITMFGKMRAGSSGLFETVSPKGFTGDMKVWSSAETHKKFLIIRSKTNGSSAIFQRRGFENGQSIYVQLNGSYSLKGASKLYGSGISAMLRKEYDIKNAKYYVSNKMWEVGHARPRKESGNVACAI